MLRFMLYLSEYKRVGPNTTARNVGSLDVQRSGEQKEVGFLQSVSLVSIFTS